MGGGKYESLDSEQIEQAKPRGLKVKLCEREVNPRQGCQPAREKLARIGKRSYP